MDRFLNYLGDGSIIVVDNASYSYVMMSELPNKRTRVMYDPHEPVVHILKTVEPHTTRKKKFY
jgi:hypothetical protein